MICNQCPIPPLNTNLDGKEVGYHPNTEKRKQIRLGKETSVHAIRREWLFV
jgi:hypothetical protein